MGGTSERNRYLQKLFPEGIGPYEQEKVVMRIRRHFPEVSREDLYKMNPGQLVIYLKAVWEAESNIANVNTFPAGLQGKNPIDRILAGPDNQRLTDEDLA